MRLIAQADLEAFDEFYRRTSPWLSLRLRRRCPDEGLVAEVLQDTYLTVWQAAGSFVEQGAGPSGWLWTVAGRRLVDGLRVRKPGREVPAEEMPAHLARTPGADEEALAATVGDDVGVALDRLAPELRQVLQAMVLDGFSVRETSVLLGLPEGTVKSRARRARSALREALS